MFWMWCSAVRVEMNSCVAISPAVRPSATRRSTSISRRLRPPGRAWRARGRRVAAGDVDLLAGVDGGVAEVERRARRRSSSAARFAPSVAADAVAEVGELGDVVEARRLAATARRAASPPASRRSRRSNSAGTLASVMISCGTLPARWNAAMASANSTERGLGLAVGGVQAGRVAGEEALEELDAVLAHEGDALVPGRERAARVGLRERHARDPERVRDPVRVAERSRGGDGLLGERECLLDAAADWRPSTYDGEAVARDRAP